MPPRAPFPESFVARLWYRDSHLLEGQCDTSPGLLAGRAGERGGQRTERSGHTEARGRQAQPSGGGDAQVGRNQPTSPKGIRMASEGYPKGFPGHSAARAAE